MLVLEPHPRRSNVTGMCLSVEDLKAPQVMLLFTVENHCCRDLFWSSALGGDPLVRLQSRATLVHPIHDP